MTRALTEPKNNRCLACGTRVYNRAQMSDRWKCCVIYLFTIQPRTLFATLSRGVKAVSFYVVLCSFGEIRDEMKREEAAVLSSNYSRAHDISSIAERIRYSRIISLLALLFRSLSYIAWRSEITVGRVLRGFQARSIFSIRDSLSTSMQRWKELGRRGNESSHPELVLYPRVIKNTGRSDIKLFAGGALADCKTNSTGIGDFATPRNTMRSLTRKLAKTGGCIRASKWKCFLGDHVGGEDGSPPGGGGVSRIRFRMPRVDARRDHVPSAFSRSLIPSSLSVSLSRSLSAVIRDSASRASRANLRVIGRSHAWNSIISG